MKNKMRKLLCAILTAIMLVTCIPVNYVSAETDTVQIPDDAVEFDGHYYKVLTIEKAWGDANSYCSEMGGHLVTITSSIENNFIFSMIKKVSGNHFFHLGLLEVSEGNWQWITGESLSYTNWGDGQPDNDVSYGGNQDRGLICNYETDFGHKCWPGQWDDGRNTTKLYFICEWEPNEQIITGTLTGGSSASKVAIDGTWYEYDTSVPGLAETIDKFIINQTITCKIRFGKIVACSKGVIRSNAIVSVNTTCNKIEYDSKNYSPKEIGVSVNITNRLTSQTRGKINTSYISGYDITFDRLVFDSNYGGMLYFKDGWFGLGKTREFEKQFDSAITLKPGETFDFADDLTAYVYDDYKWGENELKKEAIINVSAYNGDTFVGSRNLIITFENKNAEELVKKNEEIKTESQEAADILDKTSCVIQSDFLSEIFTKEQLTQIQQAIQCKIALCALPESTYKKAGIEDRIIEKLMKKAGVNKDWLGTSYTADISLAVNVDTEKHGQLEVEINLPTTYYSFGSDNPYGGTSFDFNYEITGGKGKKNIPSDKLSGSIFGLGTYANVENFADSVQSVALAQLESAYNLGYGNDLNKVGEMLFGGTMTEILSKTDAKSYSHLSFTMMTFPAKKASIRCPVDVYVYDINGDLCASVENNEVTMSCDDIDIEVIGDEKFLTVYEGDYSFEIISTANDEMNITIEEYSSPDNMISTTSFENLSLTPGDSFKTEINENYVDEEYQITKNEEEVITADNSECYLHYVQPVEVIDKDATCTEDGKSHIECKTCGETVDVITIPATGHSYKEEIIAPTKTEQGYTKYTCSCGDTYNDNFVDALGFEVKGSIISFGNNSSEITFELIKLNEEESAYTSTIEENSSVFGFEGVEAGSYILRVSKENHVTREYEIEIDEDIELEIQLNLVGDINGDGKINTVDVARANACAKSVNSLEGYELACADVNNDGKVNTVDVAKMNAHAKGITTLW